MANFKIDTSSREGIGKGVSRKLRAQGVVPAVLYGQKETPIGLSISEADMRTILHAHPDSAIVDLKVGSKTVNAIVRDTQRHPATGKLLHVDFQRIRLDEKVRVEVHVVAKGTPIGVKNQGGILEHATRTVNIMCLPGDIPESIEVDVSELSIHDHLRLKDVSERYPNVEWLDDLESSLAAVLPPVVEAAPETDEEAEVEGAAEKAEGEEEKKADDE